MYEEYTVVKDVARGNFAILRTSYAIGAAATRAVGRTIVKDGMTYNEACGSLKKFYTE